MNGNENQGRYRIILASISPRRKELLNQVGIEPEVRPGHMAEETGERKPDRVVMELSRQRAEDIAAEYGAGTMVTGAGTVVVMESEIPGKSGTPMKAYKMTEKLRGRTHQVYTGVTVLLCQDGGMTHDITFAKKTDVHVYPMTPMGISEYIGCPELLDKAGVCGIQGRFAAHIKGTDGDYASVVGLPLGRLNQEIKGFLEDREDD